MFDEPKRMTMMDDRLLRLGDQPHAAPPSDRTPIPRPSGFDVATLKIVSAPAPVSTTYNVAKISDLAEPVLAGDLSR